jgi:predicted DNA-binding transcriptional regulator AlpA
VELDVGDLLDTTEVAAVLGLSNWRGVHVYRRRYEDFPTPIIERGRCLLWQRSEVEKWARKTGRLK